MVAPLQSATPLPTAIPQANIRPRNSFPQDEFATIPNVPVFAEHQTTSRDGRQLRYTVRELQAIANRCNDRIRQSGDYAALTLGHTPTAEQMASGAAMPELVGFAGPFRIGTLGEGPKQRYAILADFHVFRDELARVKKHPRRSPEVWLEDRYEDQFLDPIALLGAEAPRLDMGLVYARTASGKVVEKYSAVAPGPTNTFIPSDDTRRNYAASDPQPSQRSGRMLAVEEVKQIVDAIEQLPWVQAVKTMLQSQQAPGASADEDSLQTPGAPGVQPADPSASAVPPAAPAPPLANTDDGQDPERMGRRRYGAEDTGPVGLDPAAGAPGQVPQAAPPQGGQLPAGVDPSKLKLSRVLSDLNSTQQQLAAMQRQLDAERGKRVDAERYSALADKARYYAFDIEREFERCRYSKLNDQQFTDHLNAIDENYKPSPIGASLFVPDTGGQYGGGARQPERYSRELSDRARSIAEAKALRGEPVSYEQVLSELMAGRQTA